MLSSNVIHSMAELGGYWRGRPEPFPLPFFTKPGIVPSGPFLLMLCVAPGRPLCTPSP